MTDEDTPDDRRRRLHNASRRSRRWYQNPERNGVLRRAMVASMGLEDGLGDRPLIGICNTWSELNPCHRHFRTLADSVRRGITEAGGIALEFNTMSLHELFFERSTMLYRNLVAMETQESLRSQPLDGVVLLGGCDKTIPAQLMALAEVDIPALVVPAGPTLQGRFRGEDQGAGTDATRMFGCWRAGEITDSDLAEFEATLVPGPGTCAVMGTATTMAAITETLGLALPGATAYPAVDARRERLAERTGRQVVEMTLDATYASGFLGRASLENAVRVLMALGGSTNAVLHLLAIGRRRGGVLELADFDTLSADTPMLSRVKPNGPFSMRDFLDAGGVEAVLKEMEDKLDLSAPHPVHGTLGGWLAGVSGSRGEAIAVRSDPVAEEGGLVVVRGSLAPDGAIIKQSAASTHLRRHTGRAVVFEDARDLIEQSEIEGVVNKDDIMILRGQGPVGAPGMPESGQRMLVPARLRRQGVEDMVRITDGRMSGTMYGTIVLHVSPEASVGGPLALVRTGDLITLDIEGRRLDLLVNEEELASRRASWTPPDRRPATAYEAVYVDSVEQAHLGCDFVDTTAP
jgi:dihydroxy-acid dehydratase